jgi:hypothetical protein
MLQEQASPFSCSHTLSFAAAILEYLHLTFVECRTTSPLGNEKPKTCEVYVSLENLGVPQYRGGLFVAKENTHAARINTDDLPACEVNALSSNPVDS